MTPQKLSTTSRSTGAAPERIFTVEQANGSLVLVRRIVGDIVARYRNLLVLKQQRDELHETLASDEVRDDVDRRLKGCMNELNRLHQELTSVGCVLKDWASGLVDFPARHENRRVWLCWRLGEDRVRHWHELHEGFTGRRPVDSDFGQSREVA